jgi:hypothetical protein
MPATEGDRIVERRTAPDAPTRRLEIGAGVDQHLGHIEIVAAGRRVQWCLGMTPSRDRRVRIGVGVEQQPRDLGSVGEVAGPVGHEMQRRARHPLAVLEPG